jgi:hypothetical protein
MTSPDEMERRTTLVTAAARHDELRLRDSLGEPPLEHAEALELLVLGEVIARKASYGRQLGVRSARAAGASWAEIGAALGTSKQAAWEAHGRWIDEQAEQHRRASQEGFDPAAEAAARDLAMPDPT